MHICIINPECDPALVGWNLYDAINRLTPHSARHITGYLNPGADGGPLSQNKDIIAGETHSTEETREIVNSADVLHFNQYDWNYKGPMPWSIGELLDGNKKPKLVFHGHGGAWLLNPQEQIDHCAEAGATMVTCSPIDEAVVPGIRWMPNILPLKESVFSDPLSTRQYGGGLVAGLANNAPEYKGGTMASYVFEYLRRFGYDVELQILRRIPWAQSIQLRHSHHFTIDNWTQGFFGMAGLEGLALGHVVIARLDPMARRKWEERFGDVPPICDVRGMDECAAVVRKYYGDRTALKNLSQQSHQWALREYSEERIVNRWIEFYESL